MAFKVPPLPYAYNALEPHIDEATMRVHHDKHHAAYVAKLNAAVEKEPSLEGQSVEELLRDLESVPESVRTAVRNHGGGHFNHSLFWEVMAPDAGGQPEGELLAALEDAFGSLDGFKKRFADAAVGVFGSGWAWLAVTEAGTLEVVATPNQDTPLSQGLVPVLGVDVWEHAYYLKYQNRRPDYVAAFFNVINWPKVAELFEKARG